TVDGGSGANTLMADASGATTAQTMSINGTSITGNSGAFHLDYSAPGGSFTSVSVLTGSGNDAVGGTGTSTNTVVKTGGGSDSVMVASPTRTLGGFAGMVNVDGGAGSNSLTVDDSGSTTAQTAMLSGSGVQANGTFNLAYLATGGNFGGGVNL